MIRDMEDLHLSVDQRVLLGAEILLSSMNADTNLSEMSRCRDKKLNYLMEAHFSERWCQALAGLPVNFQWPSVQTLIQSHIAVHLREKLLRNLTTEALHAKFDADLEHYLTGADDRLAVLALLVEVEVCGMNQFEELGEVTAETREYFRLLHSGWESWHKLKDEHKLKYLSDLMTHLWGVYNGGLELSREER